MSTIERFDVNEEWAHSGVIRAGNLVFLKEIPHNMGGSLTDDFQPSAVCKFLDLPPGACQPVLAEICPLDRFPGARTQ